MNGSGITRQEGLGLAGLAIDAPAFFTKADFKDLKWDRDTFARVKGDLDPGRTPTQLPALAR